MNRIHRIVWNRARGCYVVANEHAAAKGKPSGKRERKRVATCGSVSGVSVAVAAALLALGAGQAMAAGATCNNATLVSVDNGALANTAVDWQSGNCTVDTGATIVAASSTAALSVWSASVGTLTNNGTITSTNTQDLEGAVAVWIDGGTIGALINNGMISSANASGVNNRSYSTSTVNTIGTLLNETGATILGGTSGIVNDGIINTLTNRGLIIGTTSFAGVENRGYISTLTNDGGTISGVHAGIYNGTTTYGPYTSGTIGSLTNSGTIIGDSGILNEGGTIGTLTNTNAIIGNSKGIGNTGTIDTLANSGTISGYYGIENYSDGVIETLTNSGLISALTAITNQGRIGTLTNSGLISATTAINNWGRIETLINTGTISSSGTGVYNNNGGTIGTLTNTGIINGYYGIENYSGSVIETLTNTGAINGYYGIYNDSDGVIETLTNSGLIHGDSRAIYNYGTIGVLTNSGRIEADDEYAVYNTATIGTLTNEAGGAITSGYIGIENNSSGTISTLTNSGLISASYAIDNSGRIGTLTNTGTISGSNTGVYNGSSGTIDILTNSGTITGGTSGIRTNGTITSLNNSGLISGGTYAIYIGASSAYLGTLINTGTIAGDIVNLSTNDLNIVGGSGTGGSATWGILTGYGDTTGSGTVGTISSANSAVNLSGNNLLNDHITGTTNVTNTGNLKITNVSEPLTITGSFTNASSATYTTSVASMSSYSQLVVTGDVTLGGTIAVNVIGAASLTDGGILHNVITSGGTLYGNFSSISDNSYLYDFVANYDNQASGEFALQIEAANENAVTESVIANSNTAAVGAARVLDTIVAGSSGTDADWSAVTTALGQMSSSQQVSQAVSQTLPLMVSGTQAAARSAMTSVNRVIQARTESNQGLSSGDSFASDGNLWIKPFGSRANQSDKDGVTGYTASTAGLAIGVDTAASEHTRLGLALAYANAQVDSNSDVAPNNASIDLYQLITYGSYVIDSRREINWQLDLGHNNNRGNRSISFMGTTARSSYSSFTLHAGVGMGWNFPLSENTLFLPSIRADYSRIKDDAYSETGAGVLNLNVEGQAVEQMIWSADAKIRRQMDNGLALTANAGVGYDSINQRASTVAVFAGDPGASFTTYGLDTGPWVARAGLGLSKTTGNGMEISARYDAELRNGFSNQTASVKARWMF
jgi:autotransporter family porin